MDEEPEHECECSPEEQEAISRLYEEIMNLCEQYEDNGIKSENIMGILCRASVRHCVSSCENDPMIGLYLHQRMCNCYLLEWLKNDRDEFEKFIMTAKDEI